MENQPLPQAKPNPAVLNEPGEEREIDLVELGYELLDKLRYILIAAALGVALAALYAFVLATPMYEAVAKLYVLNSSDSVVNLSDLQLGNYLASDYTEVFKTWEVNEMVRTNLGLDYTYAELEDMVTVANPADTRILYITVKSSNPQEATSMANEYARVVSDFVSKIMATERPNTLSLAIVPTIPVSPRKTISLIIGLLLGIFLSMAAVVVHFVLDDTIKSADDVTKYTGLAVLAIIPMQGEREEQKNKRRRSETV